MTRTCPFREVSSLVCLAVGLALSVIPLAASAQDWSTQERLDRLERDLNMLQRQVYRGAPTTASGGDATSAASTEVRLEALEQQMRDLTGKVEEFSNQVSQLRQRLEQVNTDNQVRESMGGDTPPQPGVPGPPPRRYASQDTAPGTVVPGPGQAPQPLFGTLTPPGQRPVIAPPQPQAAVADAGPERASVDGATVQGGGTPAEQYNRAFGLVRQADYPGAEAALRAFIQAHPRDPLVASAQYWVGETLYARQKYSEAASAFADGYKRYPKGPKAPEELLKLGMALGHTSQKQNACVAFAELDHAFPNASPAVRRAAGEEKRRLSCG